MSSAANVAKDIQPSGGPWALEHPKTRWDYLNASFWHTPTSIKEDSFNTVRDALIANDNKPLTGFSYVLRILPKPLKAGLGKVMENFNKLPYMKNMQCWGKWFLFQEAITDTVGAVFGFAKGYKNTDGGFLDKIWGGVKNSAKSLFKAAVCCAVGFVAPMALLAVFKKSATGWLGAGINIIGGIASSILVQGTLDKFLPTDFKPKTAPTQPDGSAPPQSPYTFTGLNLNDPKTLNAFQATTAANAANNNYMQQYSMDALHAQFGGAPNQYMQSLYASERR